MATKSGIKVGIPEGLLYYTYFPMWRRFFEELGAEIVTSGPTTKSILDSGVSLSVDDACLPVKTFHGHVYDLKDKVDFIFIPRIVSVEQRSFICPKFMGLPDMIKHSVPDLPPMIDVCVDLSKQDRNFVKTVNSVGKIFTRNPLKIYKAWTEAKKEHQTYTQIMHTSWITPQEALKFKGHAETCASGVTSRIKVGVAGHPYNIYDSYTSMKLIDKLRELGASVLTPEMVPENLAEEAAEVLPKKLFWTHGRRVFGAAIHMAGTKMVDGILHVSAFGCGPDSIVAELLERYCSRLSNIPMMALNIDEHTGEAGIMTRLEAFVDMLERRNCK